jgi:hypothetical protein
VKTRVLVEVLLEVADPAGLFAGELLDALEIPDLWLMPVEFSTPVELDLGYGVENKML